MSRTFWEWVFFIIDKYGVWIVKGAGVTLLIALTGTIIGFLIGLIIGIIKTIPLETHKPGFSLRKYLLKSVNIFLSMYIEAFRGTPMMVQAMVIFYGLKEAFNVDLSPMVAGIFIVSINTGAYMAEIVRGGIESIDPGQTEAAQAIGMSHTQTMVNIILPQAIRNILPATGNEFVINIKDTSVLNVISITELFFVTKTIKGAIYRTYEPFLVVAVVYLILTLSVTKILRMIEKKMDGPDSYTVYGSSSMTTSVIKGHRKREDDQ